MATTLPDGTVTVVFTDLEGSTALRSALGDDRASVLMDTHAGIIRGLLDEHGGLEVKALGDGFMLVFTSTRRAVEFALAVHQAFSQQRLGPTDRPLRIRIGMHTGEVVARDGDLFGQAVHAAARVQAAARGGETLASDLVRTLAGTIDGIAWEDRGEHELKGFDTPWILHALLPAATPTPDTRPALVGRSHERARLVGHLDDLATGTGSLVLIEGEAGVGKTRLADEVAAEATARGFRVLSSRCSERLLTTPFGPWVDLLRAGIQDTAPETLRAALGDAAGEIARVLPELRLMFPDIPEPLQLPPDQERHFVLLSVVEFLARAAADRPLVLVVDDLQWADQSSLALIEYASPHVPSHSVMVLATHRPAVGELATLVADLTTHGLAERLALRPLDADGASDLLAVLAGGDAPPPGVVRQLVARTGGNPFFLEELFAHLAELGTILDEDGAWAPHPDLSSGGIPDSIRLVLQARLARLDRGVLPVLAAAAVVGRSSELQLVGRVAGSSPGELVEALDAAERTGLLATEPDPSGRTLVTFAHDLIRDAVLDELTHVRRQQLHLQAAEGLLEAVGDERARAAEIAAHLLAAGDLADREVTARVLCAAGESALDASAYADAQRAFERVVDLGVGDRRLQADAHRGLGYALRSTEGWEASLPHLMEALDDYEALGDHAAIGELCADIALELAWALKVVEGFRVIDRGLRALGALGAEQSAAWLRLAAYRGSLLALVGATGEALDALDEVVDRVDEVDDPRGRASIQLALGQMALQLASVDQGLRWLRPAVDRLREVGDLWQLTEGLGWLGFMLSAAGSVDELADVLDELEPLTERLQHANGRILYLRCRRAVALQVGDLARAHELVEEDHRLCVEQGYPWITQAHALRAEVAFVRGHWEEADRHQAEALATEVVGAWSGQAVGRATSLLAGRGDAEGLRRLLDEHADVAFPDGSDVTIGRVGAYVPAAMGLARVGDHEGAARYADVLRRLRDELGMVVSPWDVTPVDLAVAVAVWCDGRREEAWERLGVVRAHLQRHDLPHMRATTDLWEAWLLRQAGSDDGRAAALQADAVEGFRDLGMEGLVRAAELAVTPGRP